MLLLWYLLAAVLCAMGRAPQMQELRAPSEDICYYCSRQCKKCNASLNLSHALPGRLCARKVQQQSSQSTRWSSTSAGATIFSMASSIQFIKGVKEPTVPDVRLTRARDGSSGTASFVFKEPSVFEADNQLGDITGMYLVDDEGTLSTVDVQAKFLNGKPDRIEAKYIMRSGFEWDRCDPRLCLPALPPVDSWKLWECSPCMSMMPPTGALRKTAG